MMTIGEKPLTPMIFQSMPRAKRSKSRTVRLSQTLTIRLSLRGRALNGDEAGAKKISGQHS